MSRIIDVAKNKLLIQLYWGKRQRSTRQNCYDSEMRYRRMRLSVGGLRQICATR